MKLLTDLASQYDASSADWCDIVHPLTEEQRQRSRDWADRNTVERRLEMMTALNRRVALLHGIDPDEPGPRTAEWVRVPRLKRAEA